MVADKQYISEAEFDRRVAVKKAVVRALLRRAAEFEDLVESFDEVRKLTDKARFILCNIPKKHRKAIDLCRHCHHNTASRAVIQSAVYGRIVCFPRGELCCDRCGKPWEDETLYCVEGTILAE